MIRRQLGARALALAGLALTACAPDLGPRPVPAAPETFVAARSLDAPTGEWPADQWWKAYDDPQLDALISEAVSNAPDIKIAEARMRRAVGIVAESGAALWPQIGGDASATQTRLSLNQAFSNEFKPFLPRGWHTQGRLGATLNYELDLFGKNSAAFAAAKADAEAALIGVIAARLALSTTVAAAYADLVRLNADRIAAIDAVRVRTDTAKIVAARAKQSLEHQGQVSQAEAEVSAAKGEVAALNGLIAMTRHQIAALLGKGPDYGLDIKIPQPMQIKARGIPANLAMDLIGRRPDIVAARLHAEAAARRIDVANARFYPNINIVGVIGLQAFNIGSLMENDSTFGDVGPALHLPIFEGGKLRGQYKQARASYDEAVAIYDGTVANALREVADALVGQRTLNEQLENARAALAAGENAYRIATLRYHGGLSRYVDVLTAEDRVLRERRMVADLEARAFFQNVALVQALGGGFHAQDANTNKNDPA